MKFLQKFNIPNTFDPDDLRMRRILNIVLIALTAISLVALMSVFAYGDPVLDVLKDSDARLVVIGSGVMVILCLVLIGINRSTSIPKNIAGWILVTLMMSVVAYSDHPRELTNGRSVVFWLLPVILSVVVLPPISVFVVDIIVFVLIAVLSESVDQVNIYAMFMISLISILAWMGMSIANRAIRDARNEAEKNRAILDGVADGVVVLNEKEQVVMANPSALNMMGSALSKFALMDADRKEVGGRILSFHWSNVTGVGNVAIVRDISRQVEVERAKDAILGVVSHEMRTPLASIIGFAEVLIATSNSRDVAERIYVNAKRMITLVDDLLDHAQIQAGTLKMRRESFSPFAIANNVYELLSGRAGESEIDLRFDVAESMPEILVGDSHRYQQIMINLVANAIKFTNNGGKVELSIFPSDGRTWNMVVSDTGIGIPPERLPDIFEPFRRASDYATRAHQGAGLGLSIAKKIAQLSGGDIQVSSVVGEGSTFTVVLPLEFPN